MQNGDRLYLKPAEGLKVRNPDRNNAHMPAAGEWVTLSTYWRRRLRFADVAEAREPKPAPAARPEPKKED